MRNNLIFLIIVALVAGAVYIVSSGGINSPGREVKSVVVGDIAPDFQLEDTHGKQVSLSDLRGKIVLVNFWATWCPPCIEEMPSMERLNEVMAGDDFVMLAINTEETGRSVVPEFLAKTPYTFPILYDDKGVVQKQYGVFKFPESFVVGKDGIVTEKIIGPLDWSSVKTITYLKSLTKG
jgi:peroxiredoxin